MKKVFLLPLLVIGFSIQASASINDPKPCLRGECPNGVGGVLPASEEDRYWEEGRRDRQESDHSMRRPERRRDAYGDENPNQRSDEKPYQDQEQGRDDEQEQRHPNEQRDHEKDDDERYSKDDDDHHQDRYQDQEDCDCNHDHHRHDECEQYPDQYDRDRYVAPTITCYARNQFGVQFYGVSVNLPAAQQIAFNYCYANSPYPSTCFAVGCH